MHLRTLAFATTASLALCACGSATPPRAGTGSTSASGTTAAGTGSTSSGGGSGSSSGSSGSSGTTGSGADAGNLVAARPYYSHAPQDLDGGALPLIVMLHGYTSDHAQEGAYLGIESLVDQDHFLYAAPDGTVDSAGNRFWNATDGCCNFYGSTVDDVAYLSAVVADMEARYPVDRKRVYFVGHSNGGFMSHRMACDRADLVAGFAALAGDDWSDVSKCNPSEPVSMVQIHGTADTVIYYNGGSNPSGPYPSAPDSVAGWATKDGCGSSTETDAGVYDLDYAILGNETDVTRSTGCPQGIDVELWTMNGSGHLPAVTPDFATNVVQYLLAHPKP